MVKVYLGTLGCKLNESELEDWSRRFAGGGYRIVDDPREADLCILNTCTVTHVAAHKSRQMARQIARANPNARIVLTGCYASISPDEAARLPNVALVLPNADKDRLVTLAGNLIDDARFQATESGCRFPEAASGELPSSVRLSDNRLWSADGGTLLVLPSTDGPSRTSLRTRAFVKVMDGCNMSCTYCIIPLARGHEQSRSLREVVAEVRTLVDAGYQEIILTGVQISVYENAGDKVHGLRDLVAAILAETGVPRLRLTSIAPWDLDESLLDLWRDPRLCRHLHLSLQSGSDTVLRRMRRAYTTAQFSRVVDLARSRIPDVGVTTDVIVGFPGESEVEFDQSRAFVQAMQFSRVHVFPYSKREGTVAASLPLHVSENEKQSRARQMQDIANSCARIFASKFIGRTVPVLWETSTEIERNGAEASPEPLSGAVRRLRVWSGYTDNYIRVSGASDQDLRNRMTPVRLRALEKDGTTGEIPTIGFAI